MTKDSVVFFTACNKKYEHFACLYVFSALYHNPDIKVEIGVESTVDFLDVYRSEVDFLARQYGQSKFEFREVNWRTKENRRILPNSVRFLAIPNTKADFVYIGDIDILLLDSNISRIHIDKMKNTGLPYSNSVRPGTKRMSGLHFTSWDAYYPLPDLHDVDLVKMNDELLLYEMVQRKGLALSDKEWFRPIHGIHMSPNRQPDSRMVAGKLIPGWSIDPYQKKFEIFSASDLYKEFESICGYQIFGMLSIIKEYLRRKGMAK